MLPALREKFGNPSSLHWAGQEARGSLEVARQHVANALGARPEEVYFTSGATEADNLALCGVMRRCPPERSHLVTSAVEHHAILHTARALQDEGYAVSYVPVDGKGRVDPDDVRRAIRAETGLISIMLVNNEVGTIEPVREIGMAARERGVLMHTDAVQGLSYVDTDVGDLCVDMLSLSGHKMYAPKGIGALYVRQGVILSPTLHGGPQERGLRAGTENVPGIVGLGVAVELAVRRRAEERDRLRRLRQALVDGLMELNLDVIVNGDPVHCVAHVVSMSFRGAEAEAVLFRLHNRGFAVSMGSACTAQSIEPSHVLAAMGLPSEYLRGTIRVSMGVPTTEEEVMAFLEALPEAVRAARGI